MSKPDISIRLYGPTGNREPWTIRFCKLKGKWGETDWERRVIKISSAIRKRESIRATLIHEVVHVTVGQHGSEELAENIELNFEKAMKSLGIE